MEQRRLMQDVEIPVVVVRVGTTTCAIPSAHVVETMRRLPVTPLDGMPAFAAGVATIRGETVPVVDLGAVLGRSAEGARFVTIRADRRTVALMVDEIVGVTRLGAADIAGRRPLLTESAAPVVHALARKDQALHLVLNATRIVDHAAPRA
jgi:chemotaxis signal transduction protein